MDIQRNEGEVDISSGEHNLHGVVYSFVAHTWYVTKLTI
jgi:hypothetical protein